VKKEKQNGNGFNRFQLGDSKAVETAALAPPFPTGLKPGANESYQNLTTSFAFAHSLTSDSLTSLVQPNILL